MKKVLNMQNLKNLICRNVQCKRNDCLRNGIISLCKYSSILYQKTFDGGIDRYNGITVDTIRENCSQDIFTKKLEDSLDKWKKEGTRCIWFKVNIKNAYCVPLLAQKGFNFHHARGDFVMMYKWLPEDCEPNLPPASHTNLGVGAMVFNTKKQMLAILEKHYEYPHWKLPGGYVERGEDIVTAAIREVKEETGIETEFLSLITFRHTHKMMFDNSDIYVLLTMKALTENFTISTREVKACKWMDIEEYTNHPHVHEFNRLIVHKALEYKKKRLKLDLQKKTVKWATYTRDMSFLNIKDEEY